MQCSDSNAVCRGRGRKWLEFYNLTLEPSSRLLFVSAATPIHVSNFHAAAAVQYEEEVELMHRGKGEAKRVWKHATKEKSGEKSKTFPIQISTLRISCCVGLSDFYTSQCELLTDGGGAFRVFPRLPTPLPKKSDNRLRLWLFPSDLRLHCLCSAVIPEFQINHANAIGRI